MLGRPLVRQVLTACAKMQHRTNWDWLAQASLRVQKGIVERSGYFDSNWYLDSYADVRNAKVDPALHYLRHGAQEGRNPSERFDTEYYLSVFSEDARAGLNPLVHFALWGKQEGYSPVPSEWRGESSYTPTTGDDIRRVRHAALGSELELERAVVAIGIVAYNNSAAQIARLLKSIAIGRERLPDRIETAVFLIDNGEPVELPPDTPQVRRLAPQGNIGFAAAQNMLMREAFAASATHYIAANPDGCFHPGCLEALLRMSQAAGHRALVEALQFPDEHPKPYDPYDFDTPWATGACLLISRPLFETIGGFDPAFFMYCEDVDLSWRARNAGFAVKICPRALYMHHIPLRDYDPERHRRFLSSGLILARKWGHARFADRMLAEMKKFKFQVDGLATPPGHKDRRKVTNFNHLFSFAPARWV